MPPKLSDVAPGAAGQPPAAPTTGGTLSDEQFAKLVELLTPGYECAKIMLADIERRESERRSYEQNQQPKESAPATPPLSPVPPGAQS